MPRTRPLAPLSLALLLAGCGGRAVPENLIIVVIDALRADNLSCYGNERDTTPAIDRLAAEGILCEQAMAQCCFTPPAMASLLTGRHVPSHGLLGWEARLRDGEITLAETLKDAGYRTGAFVFLNLLTRQGLEQGFDRGEEMVEPAEKVFRLARDWIRQDPQTPFFALLHCYDVHRPYTPIPPYDTLYAAGYRGTIDGSNESLTDIHTGRVALRPEDHRHLEALYDGELRYTDDRLSEFLEELKEDGVLERTLLVVTSDHGEMLGERPNRLVQYTHDEALYDPVMKIPLVLWAPGTLPGGVRLSEQVRQIDIMPTLLGLLGIESPAGVEGAAFLDAQGRWLGESRTAFADAYPEPHRPGRYMRAIRSPSGMKMIHNIHEGTWEKYDLERDPQERENLWAGSPDPMQDALLAHAEAAGEIEELCVVWNSDGKGMAGSVALSGGRVLGVTQPPKNAARYEIGADATRVSFGGGRPGERSVLWIRVEPPGLEAQVSAKDDDGNDLPVTLYRRDTTPGSVRFKLAEIGHTYIDPFEEKRSGAYVFGRARLERQRVPISLDPQELERLEALGYIGG